MSWDWQVFCQDTIEREVVQGCFGKGGDITYLDWMLSAWGWTVSVSLLALLLALVIGSLIGTLRTSAQQPHRDPAGQRVGGAVPQHTVARANFPVVPRGADPECQP